ncbi:MAG: hypothetical protein R3B36_18130 [Polyangiaceae bacterium]
MSRAVLVVLALVLALAGGCFVDRAPGGARETPPGTGPQIVFELTRRPLPEIPQPNDVATFADPSSRTGRRINVSMVAPTRLEAFARSGFTTLEGWGTFAPISVAFAREEGADEGAPAIDIEDVYARTRDWDPRDDPFYVIDLQTGLPALLDVGKGSFPVTVSDPNRYWANDPRASADSLLFETHEEGFGLPQSAYRPELDTDFDGVLDHPNVLRPTGRQARPEEVLTWYERETDSLLLRPVVPLEQKREYAVVLTDRLKGPRGAPVRSPFSNIHHPQQLRGAERLREILSRADGARFFGDIAGTGLDHVAFTWTFTTQPVYEDMALLRDGLHGIGPFSRLASDFPAKATALRSVGFARDEKEEPPGAVDADPACNTVKKTPYIVRVADTRDALRDVIQTALGLQGEELRRLMQSLDEVDYFVVGTYESPYFLGDPEKEDPDGLFEVDFRTGQGRVTRDTVQYWLSVPKKRPGRAQPFPVTLWAHGTTLHADEILVRAGYWAKQGQAMMGINMPGHGLLLEPGQRTLAEILLRKTCMVRWAAALSAGRHRDLDGDGVPDSGGLLWTAHVFHSRDNIRQSVVDQMQATRILRSWDGVQRSDQDYNADGVPDLAGDFDGDGVPDVGGPSVAIATSGNSFGGILAMVHGAVDHNVSVAAPISGGGGLTDVATRSSLVPDSVIQQVLSPLVVAVPASSVAPRNDDARTRCAGDQRSVRFVVNDLTSSREIEIACLTPGELDAGRTVVLTNTTNGEKRCARTADDGRFRVPVPASAGDRLDVQIYDRADAVVSYKGCELRPDAPPGRRIRTFEQAATRVSPVADEKVTCDAAFEASDVDENRGCAQYRDRFFPVGSPLVAPQEGLGLHRQSPEMRRLFTLTQAALDTADPINFAPYYALRPATDPRGQPLGPRAVIEWNTAGDPSVPVGTGYAFARAAGAVPFLPPSFASTYPEWADYATPQALYDSLGGKTPEDVLVEQFVVEGLSRMGRSRAGASCAANYVASQVCTSAPTPKCDRALVDVDWLAEGKDRYDAPRLPTPLRLARSASVKVTDASSLTDAWRPRLTGVPFGPDEGAWEASEPLLGIVNTYIRPEGVHVWVNGDPCKAFDDAVYYDHALVRFIATRGKDLYFLSHPRTHACLERESCPFFAP